MAASHCDGSGQARKQENVCMVAKATGQKGGEAHMGRGGVGGKREVGGREGGVGEDKLISITLNSGV